MNLIGQAFTFISLSAAVHACGTRSLQFSRVTIENSEEWTVEERCHTPGCFPSSDYLIRTGVEIRVEPLNHHLTYITEGIFLIRVMFPDRGKENIEFDPSRAIVQFDDETKLEAKGLTCAQPRVIDRSFLTSVPSLAGYQRITPDQFCFLLFVIVPPPRPDVVFSLRLDRVRWRGQQLRVPKIIFRPGGGQRSWKQIGGE